MLIKRGQTAILLVNLIALLLFTILFSAKKNYEFLIYVGVIVVLLIIIVLTNKKVNYSNGVLWGLTLWALMHMSGGGVYIKGVRLYEIILIPLSEAYSIFRYDQLVHIIGFGVATVLMYELLKPKLKPNCNWAAVSIVIIMAGLGVGALNELLEFIATVLVPETGVGGYVNTSLDLVADLIGAVLALVIIRLKN